MKLEYPKEPYKLFTNIVDERTFMVGDETYVAEQEVKLTPEEQEELKEIREADFTLRRLRQELIDIVHPTDLTFIPDIQHRVHTLGLLGTTLKVKIPLFIMKLAVRMGGRLPLILDQGLSKVTVRARNTGESMNYTVATALDAVMLTPIMEQRTLAFILAEGDRKKTRINSEIEYEHNFQPVELDVSLTDDHLKDAMTKFLKSHPYPMSTTLMIGNDKQHYSIINYVTNAGGRMKQVDPESLREYAHKQGTVDIILIGAKMSPKRNGWTISAARHTADFDKDGKAKTNQRTFTFEMNEKGELLGQKETAGFISEGMDPSSFFALVKNPNLT